MAATCCCCAYLFIFDKLELYCIQALNQSKPSLIIGVSVGKIEAFFNGLLIGFLESVSEIFVGASCKN